MYCVKAGGNRNVILLRKEEQTKDDQGCKLMQASEIW